DTSVSPAASSTRDEAILIKLNSNGQRQWATYYGDTMADGGYSVTCDSAGNVYITGGTGSTDGVATQDAHLATRPVQGNAGTGFLAKFNTNRQRIWATYYPGVPSVVKSDKYCNVYIGGNTNFGTGNGVATT